MTGLLLFLLYSLVYVQCEVDSERICPLPFNPHKYLDSATHQISLLNSKITPLVDDGVDIFVKKGYAFQNVLIEKAEAGRDLVLGQLERFSTPELRVIYTNYLMLSNTLEDITDPILSPLADRMDILITRINTFKNVQILLLPTYRKLMIGKFHHYAVLFVDQFLPNVKHNTIALYQGTIHSINTGAIKIRQGVLQLRQSAYYVRTMDNEKMSALGNHPFALKIKDGYTKIGGPVIEKVIKPGTIFMGHKLGSLYNSLSSKLQQTQSYQHIENARNHIEVFKREYIAPFAESVTRFYETDGVHYLKSMRFYIGATVDFVSDCVDQVWMILEGRAGFKSQLVALLSKIQEMLGESGVCQTMHSYCIRLSGEVVFSPSVDLENNTPTVIVGTELKGQEEEIVVLPEDSNVLDDLKPEIEEDLESPVVAIQATDNQILERDEYLDANGEILITKEPYVEQNEVVSAKMILSENLDTSGVEIKKSSKCRTIRY